MGLFGLNIGWDVARAFLSERASAVSPTDLAFSGDDSNREFGGPFCHFGIFLSLTALMLLFV
jgi:hypothetical protein